MTYTLLPHDEPAEPKSGFNPYNYWLLHIDKIRNQWKQYPDFRERMKTFGRNKVYLFYGRQRGGIIILKFRGIKGRDETAWMDEQVHFMDWENAVSEYNSIKSMHDMHDLAERNQ